MITTLLLDVRTYVDAASALGIAGRAFTTAEAFTRDLAQLKVTPS